MVLKFVLVIIILITCPIYPQVYAQYYSYGQISVAGCNASCGDVVIPYPFGMNDPRCYVDKWFEIECRSSTPYLKSLDVEVTRVDVTGGTITIQNPIFRRNCKRKDSWPINTLRGSPFVYSQDSNKFVGKGCNTLALLRSNGSDISGCVSICDDPNKDITKIESATECNGKYCCETTLPSNLEDYNTTIEGLRDNNTHCAYAFIVQYEQSRSVYPYHSYDGNHYTYSVSNRDNVPAVLEWEILNISTLKVPADAFAYAYVECYETNITSSQQSRSGWRCRCRFGFDGNPYIAGSCAGVIPFPTPIF